MKNRAVVASVVSGLLAVAAAVPAGASSHPTLWRYAHPESKLVVGIEWRGVLESAVATKLKQQLPKEVGFQVPVVPALDFLDHIERVFVSSPGDPPQARHGAPAETRVVAAIQGRFDLAKVRGAFLKKGTVSRFYRNVPLLVSSQAGTSQCLALVSPEILLLGDPSSVQKSIDLHASGTLPMALVLLFQRASELAAAGHHFWMVGTISPAELAGPEVPQMQLLADVESFEVAVSLRDGLGVNVGLSSKSETSAKMLSNAVEGFMRLAVLESRNRPEAAGFLDKLKVTTEQNRVSVAVRLDEAEIDKGLNQLRSPASLASVDVRPKVTVPSEFKRAPTPPWVAVARSSQPPEPSKPAVIRIYGAEGGTREVTLPAPQQY